MTTAKRTYLSCATCGKDCIGRYKDDDGKPLCKGCGTPKKPGHMSLCTRCQRVHYDIHNDGICSKCRGMVKKKADVKRCPKCGGAMRTTLEAMTECINCIGENHYRRLVRAACK